MKILIYAPSYSDDSGGSIVLHKLCSILNKLGYESYIVPFRFEIKFRSLVNKSGILRSIVEYPIQYIKYLTNRHKYELGFDNELNISNVNDDDVVIYPEIIIGNPLKATNVVRWLLHRPDFFNKYYSYSSDDLIYAFNSSVKHDLHLSNFVSENFLTVVDFPIDIYHSKSASVRKGDCFIIRKGEGKELIHREDSINIDGLSHVQVAEVMKKAERFISYDPYTAYSRFAVLAGCRSIVIPDFDVTKDEWREPDSKSRYGIAYGLEEFQAGKDLETSDFVFKALTDEECNSEIYVEICIQEILDRFNLI